MSTDLQHQKQNKSMFILLSIISILVISTLVVASVYFLKPTIEAPTHEPLTEAPIEVPIEAPIEAQVDRVTVNPFMQRNPENTQNQNMKNPADIKKPPLAEVTATQTNPKTEKQDSCDVRFFENQLLVKNSDRK
jgi:flagellar basal body-associated protein FliL